MKWINAKVHSTRDFGVKVSSDGLYVQTFIKEDYCVSFLLSDILPVFVATLSGLPIPEKPIEAHILEFEGEASDIKEFLVPEEIIVELEDTWSYRIFFSYRLEKFAFSVQEILGILSCKEKL